MSSLSQFQYEAYRGYRSAPREAATCVVESCDVIVSGPFCKRHRAMLPEQFTLDIDGIAAGLLHIEDGIPIEEAQARIGRLA